MLRGAPIKLEFWPFHPSFLHLVHKQTVHYKWGSNNHKLIKNEAGAALAYYELATIIVKALPQVIYIFEGGNVGIFMIAGNKETYVITVRVRVSYWLDRSDSQPDKIAKKRQKIHIISDSDQIMTTALAWCISAIVKIWTESEIIRKVFYPIRALSRAP